MNVLIACSLQVYSIVKLYDCRPNLSNVFNGEMKFKMRGRIKFKKRSHRNAFCIMNQLSTVVNSIQVFKLKRRLSTVYLEKVSEDELGK